VLVLVQYLVDARSPRGADRLMRLVGAVRLPSARIGGRASTRVVSDL
jgi:hypothetical protein